MLKNKVLKEKTNKIKVKMKYYYHNYNVKLAKQVNKNWVNNAILPGALLIIFL